MIAGILSKSGFPSWFHLFNMGFVVVCLEQIKEKFDSPLVVIRLIKDRELDATRSNQRNYRVGAGTVRSLLKRTKPKGVNYG